MTHLKTESQNVIFFYITLPEVAMATLFESAVDHAATILAKQNLDVHHSALQEVLAGCLGYESFELLDRMGCDPSLPYQLEQAHAVILNLNMGSERAIKVCDAPEPCLDACIQAIEQTCRTFSRGDGATPISFYRGYEEFYYRHVQSVTRRCLMEEAGADATTIVPVPVDDLTRENLTNTSDQLRLGSRCIVRRNNHYPITVTCSVTFTKAARAGLVFESFESNLRSIGQPQAVLEICTSHNRIRCDDRSEGRAIVALVIDMQSWDVVGEAVDTGDKLSVAERAIDSAFGRNGRGQVEARFPLGQSCQIVLHVDRAHGGARLREYALRYNVDVKSSRHHQLLGRVERLLAPLLMCQRGSFGDCQEPVSIEDFRAYLTDRIATYHESEKYEEELIPYQLWRHRNQPPTNA